MRLFQKADLLKQEQGDVGKGYAESREKTLRQKSGRHLRGRQFIGDERAVWLHRSVVRGIEYPEQPACHPQTAAKRINKQAETAEKCANEKIRLAPAESWMPGFIAHGTDDRLNKQPCHGAGEVQQRDLVGLCAEEVVNRIDCTLLQAKTILDAKEADVHVDDLSETQAGLEMRHGRQWFWPLKYRD